MFALLVLIPMIECVLRVVLIQMGSIVHFQCPINHDDYIRVSCIGVLHVCVCVCVCASIHAQIEVRVYVCSVCYHRTPWIAVDQTLN